LKLITRESPGLRGINDPQVLQTIRDTLRNRKEQLLRAAYLAIARDDARGTNYLAEQVMEDRRQIAGCGEERGSRPQRSKKSLIFSQPFASATVPLTLKV